ncbi:MAG: phage holin family protein [Propionicimonas sp.]|nr:phage holin family protein [Propionicimonas sp.]
MAEQQDLAGIIANIQADVTAIVRGEIELVKAELVPQAKSGAVGAGLFGAAAYVAITAVTLLFFGLSFLLSLGFATWFSLSAFGAAAWGFSIMAVLLVVVAGLLVLIGRSRMNFSKPKAAISQAEESVAEVRKAVSDGLQEVKGLSLSGRRSGPELEPELEK